MFDRKIIVIAISSLAVGVAIGGTLLGNGSQAQTSFNTQPGTMRMAQSQVEPQPSRAERDFMDFTMPDLSKPKEEQDVTRHGCVKPDQPQWANDLPRSEAQKSLLLTALYDAARYQAIIENNSCPCETEYPSWDEADAQYQQIAQGKDNAEIVKLKRQVMRQVMDFQFEALTICSQLRGH
ncbi:hypothetical protein [Thioclava sp.]|uniref:hypothetical protein n=1 Tax=Thioclava sp. TaxID=1933450 RepID=UPI003242651F